MEVHSRATHFGVFGVHVFDSCMPAVRMPDICVRIRATLGALQACSWLSKALTHVVETSEHVFHNELERLLVEDLWNILLSSQCWYRSESGVGAPSVRGAKWRVGFLRPRTRARWSSSAPW